MSRQSEWRAKRVLAGLCGQCGGEPLASTQLGKRCLKKQREAMRRRKQSKRRNRNALSYKV